MEINNKYRQRLFIKMVTKDDIIKIARKEKLSLGILEKDFVLTYILRRIYNSDLKNKLIFKGGTALHKIYLHKRLSVDLDFTELNKSSLEEIRKVIESKGINSKIKDVKEDKESINIILSYLSILNFKNNIRIQISKREKPILNVIKKRLKSYFYEDFEVLTFEFEELIAEKIRALIQRNKPRDYFDIYYILNEKNIKLNSIIKLAKQKLKNVDDHYDANKIFDNLDAVEKSWEKDLKELILDMPDFNKVIEKLRKYFK